MSTRSSFIAPDVGLTSQKIPLPPRPDDAAVLGRELAAGRAPERELAAVYVCGREPAAVPRPHSTSTHSISNSTQLVYIATDYQNTKVRSLPRL